MPLVKKHIKKLSRSGRNALRIHHVSNVFSVLAFAFLVYMFTQNSQVLIFDVSNIRLLITVYFGVRLALSFIARKVNSSMLNPISVIAICKPFYFIGILSIIAGVMFIDQSQDLLYIMIIGWVLLFISTVLAFIHTPLTLQKESDEELLDNIDIDE